MQVVGAGCQSHWTWSRGRHPASSNLTKQEAVKSDVRSEVEQRKDFHISRHLLLTYEACPMQVRKERQVLMFSDTWPEALQT